VTSELVTGSTLI